MQIVWCQNSAVASPVEAADGSSRRCFRFPIHPHLPLPFSLRKTSGWCVSSLNLLARFFAIAYSCFIMSGTILRSGLTYTALFLFLFSYYSGKFMHGIKDRWVRVKRRSLKWLIVDSLDDKELPRALY